MGTAPACAARAGPRREQREKLHLSSRTGPARGRGQHAESAPAWSALPGHGAGSACESAPEQSDRTGAGAGPAPGLRLRGSRGPARGRGRHPELRLRSLPRAPSVSSASVPGAALLVGPRAGRACRHCACVRRPRPSPAPPRAARGPGRGAASGGVAGRRAAGGGGCGGRGWRGQTKPRLMNGSASACAVRRRHPGWSRAARARSPR